MTPDGKRKTGWMCGDVGVHWGSNLRERGVLWRACCDTANRARIRRDGGERDVSCAVQVAEMYGVVHMHVG